MLSVWRSNLRMNKSNRLQKMGLEEIRSKVLSLRYEVFRLRAEAYGKGMIIKKTETTKKKEEGEK